MLGPHGVVIAPQREDECRPDERNDEEAGEDAETEHQCVLR